MENNRKIAYFSMEIALDNSIPTYSGGLGVLAGDTIRSAADLDIPMIAVTLLHRKGYFYQKITPDGWQTEAPVEWSIDDYMKETEPRVKVTIEGREVSLRAWRYETIGEGGFVVPVYLLDVDLPENDSRDRELTHYLYAGDRHYRLCQEIILGIGGVRMLRALGYDNIVKFHMNEGHAGLLTLELLDEQLSRTGQSEITEEILDIVKEQCVFTTHTPVEAGHDKFSMDLVDRVLGNHQAFSMKEDICHDRVLNMTYLALNLSHYINGVAKRHGEVSRQMFGTYAIDSITNGVHAPTWVSEPFQHLFDRYIKGWRRDNFSLRYAHELPRHEVWKAHTTAKNRLIEEVNRRSNVGMDHDHFTIGFARRATRYKRIDLLFHDIERLSQISKIVGPIQVIYAGKAHPQDNSGKEMIKRIHYAAKALQGSVKVVYLANYDMNLAKLLVSGVDVWLNTPEPPLEASGTSGMKAALNGVPSLSVLDGWWLEGCIEGVTGWAIGGDPRKTYQQMVGDNHHVDSLYQKLEETIVPLFYQDRDAFIDIMMHCIAVNGSFFNTQRMVQQYVLKAYF